MTTTPLISTRSILILFQIVCLAVMLVKAERHEDEAEEAYVSGCFETLCDCDDFFDTISESTCSRLFVPDACKWQDGICSPHTRVRGAMMDPTNSGCDRYKSRRSCLNSSKVRICSWEEDDTLCRYRSKYRAERAQVQCFSCSNTSLAPKFTSQSQCNKYMKSNGGKCNDSGLSVIA